MKSFPTQILRVSKAIDETPRFVNLDSLLLYDLDLYAYALKTTRHDNARTSTILENNSVIFDESYIGQVCGR